MGERISRIRDSKFARTRAGASTYGVVIGFGAGFGAGEMFKLVDNNLIHEPHNFPPYLTGAMGAIALGSAFWRERSQNARQNAAPDTENT